MSFGSFLRGLVAQANPFDNGRTYGTYNPPKKRDINPDPSYPRPQPVIQTVTPANKIPTAHSPVSFGTLHINNTVALPKPQQTPHYGFWQKAGDMLGGVTTGVAEIPLGVARAATGAVEGLDQLPALGLKGVNAVSNKIGEAIARSRGEVPTPAGHWAVTRDVNNWTNNVNERTLDPVNRGLDTAAKFVSTHGVGDKTISAKAGKTGYKTSQIGANVIAMATGVGEASNAAAASKAAQGTKAATVLRKVGTQLSPATEVSGVVSRIANPIAKIAHNVINTPIRGTKNLINAAGNRITRIAGGAEDLSLPAQVTQIPVTNASPGSVPIPVAKPSPIPITDVTPILPGDTPALSPVATPPQRVKLPGKLIQDVSGGETWQTPDALIAHNAEEAARASADAFNASQRGNIADVTPRTNQPFSLSAEDIATNQQKIIDDYAATLKNMGEGNGVAITSDGRRVSGNVRFGDTKGKRMTKADWQAEAESQLKNGKGEPGVQQAFDDVSNPEVQSQLNQEPASVEPGKPINVKQVQGIDVQQVNDVPVNVAETPGKVRMTKTTEPVKTQTEAVAAQAPTTAPTPVLPPEVQAVLDNPRQFNKRQVAAARNQRKLAKQYAKVQADKQAIIESSPALAPKPAGNPGFVPTGEFRRGVNGNVSEVAHAETEAAQAARDTATLSTHDVLDQAINELQFGGHLSPESARNLQSLVDTGRLVANSPEAKAIADVRKGGASNIGRALALWNKTIRRTATGDQLANRFTNKLLSYAEDSSKLSDADVAIVQQAENAFTTARDVATQALDRYNATKDATDFAAWKQAQQAAEAAEKESFLTEYRVANRVLKGNKSPEALKAVQEAEKKAGVYQMDWIDANMLSGTGTATRNFVNTALVRLENRLSHPFNRNYAAGAKIGNEMGLRSVVSDFKARNELDQNSFSKAIKQWSTTANTLGEGNIRAVGTSRAYNYYAKQLERQGVTGDQLKRDVEVMLHTDPDGAIPHYEGWALNENALSGLAHSKKFEQELVKIVAGQGGGKLTQTGAKALVRLTVGFPTVIARSLIGGAKRATLGLPDLAMAGKAFAKGDKQALADALYSAKVHAGSGAVLYALGTALAEAGLITPSYPDDPAERAKWKAEGTQPNSIKIGGQWFSIPGYFGALALPFVLPANIMNKDNPADIAKGIIAGVGELAPTAGLINFIDGMEGRGGKQWLKNELTSVTRAFTPLGSLFNQIAKMTDDTKNNTTTKDAIHNLLDSIASGIPGVNNLVNTIDATDDNGNVLHNPNPVATFFGAQGAEQKQGIEDARDAQSGANKTYTELRDFGVLDNPTLMSLVDKKIQAQISKGRDLSPDDVKSVQKAVTKGIGTGISADSDSNWRENGDYATDRTAMKVKMSMLEADPTAKKSEINNLKIQIARDDVLEKNNVPYEDLKLYEKTSQTEWAAMGRPQYDKKGNLNEAYDPDTYAKLKNLDDLLTEAGGSYKDSEPTKNKFNPKGAGTGYGEKAEKGPKMETSFGTLSTSGNPFAPKTREYQTASLGATSNIPVINVVRPHIVHEIKTGQV